MSGYKVLIVDDDDNICQLLNLYLIKEGYTTHICNNGKDAVMQLAADEYHVVLLDIMMPDMDGYETLTAIRKSSSVPVIMMSAKGDPLDKISGFDCGADDYVTKPFEMQELISRIKAILRRTQPQSISDVYADIHIGNLFIDRANYIVQIDGKKIEMPPKEIELLYYLAKNPMRVFTRDQLLSAVWGYDYKGDSRTVDVHIKRIREKIGNSTGWRLATVWSIGYKFEVL